MLDIRGEIARALGDLRGVVALESTLIAHGLPWPVNRETALASEQAVRAEGAIPATIAILGGKPTIGLTPDEITRLAQEANVRKASRRDLASAVTQRATAATTVAGTMALAHRAGIRVFATGGIGGVHPGGPVSWDVSADLHELARTPMIVVCAGAKSILDLPATLEVLETLGVPVVGFGVNEFPAFYVRSSGLPVSARVHTPEEVTEMARTHWELGGGGLLVVQPVAEEFALDPTFFHHSFQEVQKRAQQAGVSGPALTPFLLGQLAEITGGQTLRANRALIVANAGLAGKIASITQEM
jgi:pseudouridine-5'-phosphate glycosidase